MAAGMTATSRIRWVQREQTQLLRPTCLALAGLYCVVYACKTFLRVRNGDPWLDVANRQGMLGRSWTRLGSEARWTSQMPVGVALPLHGDWLEGGQSDALPLCGDWLEGGQRSAAASFGRQTRARCDLNTRAESLHRRPRVSEAPQEGSRRLSWALRHSAFTCF